MKLLGTFLSLLGLFGLCHGQGAPWTEEETKVIKEKVWKLLNSNQVVIHEFKQLNPGYGAVRQTGPDFKKVFD